MKREAAKASPPSPVLLLPVVPHVGETDTDTLTEIPGRPAEEEEDEFGYNWSELDFCFPLVKIIYIPFATTVKTCCHVRFITLGLL